jgi:hypothetical protein
MFEMKIEKSGIEAVGSVEIDESENLFIQIKVHGKTMSDVSLTEVEARVLKSYFESLDS